MKSYRMVHRISRRAEEARMRDGKVEEKAQEARTTAPVTLWRPSGEDPADAPLALSLLHLP